MFTSCWSDCPSESWMPLAEWILLPQKLDIICSWAGGRDGPTTPSGIEMERNFSFCGSEVQEAAMESDYGRLQIPQKATVISTIPQVLTELCPCPIKGQNLCPLPLKRQASVIAMMGGGGGSEAAWLWGLHWKRWGSVFLAPSLWTNPFWSSELPG